MTDLRDALSHVLWLGGAPRAGKTTLSRLLAGKYDLRIYNLDWHHVREHRQRGGAEMRWWDERTRDELWIDTPADELLERSVRSWEEGFALVVEDLLRLPRARPILADGPGALPWLVAPSIRSPRQALFLVPTAEVWARVLDRRYALAGARYGDEMREPATARAHLRERDERLGERIASSCSELGLRCVRIDGSLDLDDSLAVVEEHFRPHLPETYNV